MNKINLLSRISKGLSRSSSKFSQGLIEIYKKRKLNITILEELEELLITTDLGVNTTKQIIAFLEKNKFDREIRIEEIKEILVNKISDILIPVALPFFPNQINKPHVVLVVGVNGSGKTTTIGKLANLFCSQGLSVTLVAGDTFRAAAIEQLKIIGERAGCPVISSEHGKDAASLAFDALQKTKLQNDDLLLIDTAGRMQNKKDLMAELEKIIRVLKRHDPTAPHDILLVLDATTGQNAHSQVEIFQKITNVSGLIITKLDGTARGGVLVAIAERFKLPIHAICIGEGIDDLQPFEARSFAHSLFGLN
ncbi:MAG: signal recognition particle-docking protein FtsY [Rhodospirillaceae bacterium]|jgi:fused signal recognition particle receptor|nr:signal recognition particle-docking protein FtsY [Rhodospirillaceae bacterium]